MAPSMKPSPAIYGFENAAVGCLPYGSGNDFLRTFGTKAEFLDLDAQLAGGPVAHRSDADQPWPFGHHLRCRSGCAGRLRHPEVPAHPAVRRRERPMRFPLWNSCADTSAAGWSTPSMVKRWHVDCLMCAICNGRTYGGGFCAAPEAQPDDGWLDVYIIRKVSRVTIAKLLGMYKSGRALPERSARQGGRAVLHLPPRKAGELCALRMAAGLSLPRQTVNAHPRSRSLYRYSRWQGASFCQSLLLSALQRRGRHRVQTEHEKPEEETAFLLQEESCLFFAVRLIFSSVINS